MRGLAAIAPEQACETALPLLGELWSNKPYKGRLIVLDLAAASRRRVEMFCALRCRATMLDFNEWIDGPDTAITPGNQYGTLDISIPCDPQHRPNVVLCWDFLNYIQREQLPALAAQICRAGGEGMLFHAVIAYTADTMPARPCHFMPCGNGLVTVDLPTQEPVRSPRYSPAALMKLLPGFEVHKARLLKNGYQEYLLRWTGTTTAKPVMVRGFEARPQPPVTA